MLLIERLRNYARDFVVTVLTGFSNLSLAEVGKSFKLHCVIVMDSYVDLLVALMMFVCAETFCSFLMAL